LQEKKQEKCKKERNLRKKEEEILQEIENLRSDFRMGREEKLERIRIRPESYVTKLVGDSGYKLRVGDYRVIMDINKGKLSILVIKIGHRRNIYNQ